jgi:small subunit ribosomal protein S17
MMKTRGMKRQVVGTIVSNKMENTVVVVVERLVKHPHTKNMFAGSISSSPTIRTTLVTSAIACSLREPALEQNQALEVSRIIEKAV